MAKKKVAPTIRINGGPNTALLVIDVQRGLFNKNTPIYQAEQLLKNIHILVRRAHEAEAPVVYVQHSAQKHLVLGSNDWKLHPKLSPLPEDLRVEKLHGNAFEATPLMEELEAWEMGQVVVCGLVTNGCVKATTLGALELGYRVVLAGDAHSSYSKDAAKLIEEWNARLAEAGAEVRLTAEIDFRGEG
ncbi:MAG: cysteine hydrolase [Anaerolineales bacterium]|jgi:nicotinamidase-related amidase|nr:cysteine hydrolase [Anaerolineales bacterium]